MLEEATKNESKATGAPAAEVAGRKPKKKKSRPTNCAQSNKRIRRKDWYYRDGKYFANKQCFKLYAAQEAEKSKKKMGQDLFWLAASAAAAGVVEKILQPNDVVLIKGSRSVKMEAVVEELVFHDS